MKASKKAALVVFIFFIFLWFYEWVSSAPESYDEHRAAKESQGWIWNDPDKGLKIAAEENKRVLVYIWSRYCTFCARMEREVFPNETVRQTIFKYYVPVVIDIDSKREMAYKYGATLTPTFIFLDKNGNILGRSIGYKDASRFNSLLESYLPKI